MNSEMKKKLNKCLTIQEVANYIHENYSGLGHESKELIEDAIEFLNVYNKLDNQLRFNGVQTYKKKWAISDLPTFDECSLRVQLGTANALHQFIYNNEPAGFEYSEKFRKELCELLNLGRG